MKKAILYSLIIVIIGVIFLSINTISQNEDIDESIGKEAKDAEGQEIEPLGRNISIELEENMGFTAP